MVNEKYKKKYLKYKKKYLKYKKNKIFVGGMSNFASCVPSRDNPDSCDSFILSLKLWPGGEEVKQYKINPNLKENIHKYIDNFIRKTYVDEKKNDNPYLFCSYDYEKYYKWFMEWVMRRHAARNRGARKPEEDFPPLKNWKGTYFMDINKFKLDYHWLSSIEKHYSFAKKNLRINNLIIDGDRFIEPDTYFKNLILSDRIGTEIIKYPINNTIEVFIDREGWETLKYYYDLRAEQIKIFEELEDIIINYINRFSNAAKFQLCKKHAELLEWRLSEKKSSSFFPFFTDSIEELSSEIIEDRINTFTQAGEREGERGINSKEVEVVKKLIFDGWSDNIPAVKKYIEELCGKMYNNIKEQMRLEIPPEGFPPPYPHQDLPPEGKPPPYPMLPSYSSLYPPPASPSNALRRSASRRDSSEFATPRHSPPSPR